MSLLVRHSNRTVAAWIAVGVLLIAGAAVAQVDVTIDHVLGLRNSTVSVPVRLANVVEGDSIYSIEILLSYDPRLVLEDVRYEGKLADWFIDTTLDRWWVEETDILEGLNHYLDAVPPEDPSTYTLQIAGATGNMPITASGVLFYLDFLVPNEYTPQDVMDISLNQGDVLLNTGDPAHVAAGGSVTLVGNDGTITSDPASVPTHAQTILVTVIDADEDRTPDGGDADSVPVRVTVENPLGTQLEMENLFLLETAAGTFELVIQPDFLSDITSGDGTLQVKNGDYIRSCYDDSLDASGADGGERCATSQVFLIGADGVITSDPTSLVSSLDVQVTIIDDDDGIPDAQNSVLVQVTVKNQLGSQVENLFAVRQAEDRFELPITTLFSPDAVSDDDIVQVQNGDSLFFCYDDVLDEEGGTTVRCDTTLVELEGTNGSLTSDPPTLASIQDILGTVTDDDGGIPVGATSGPVRVTVGTQVENLSALKGASGVFELVVQPEFSSPVPDDGIVQVQNGDQIDFCYDDPLDSIGEQIEVCATTMVLSGVPGSITATAAVEPDELVRIRVVDADLNVDPGVKETVSVTVISRDDETGVDKDEETIVLEAIDVDSDVFFGEAATVFDGGAGSGEPGDQLLRINRADLLLITYFDVAAGIEVGQASLEVTCDVVDPWGDASGNGKLGGQDAAMILSHSVGAITLTGLKAVAANVDFEAPYNSPIDADDASLVLRRRVGLIDHFPIQESASKNNPQPAEDPPPDPKLLVAERAIALEARFGYIAVVAEGRDEILSGDLMLRGFSGRVTMADELADFLLVSNESEGETRIAFAGVQPVSGAGELLRLLPATADRVELERASFNGGRIVGRLQGMGAVALPEIFELKPNVPNPFNPETSIRYALPHASQVSLEIFNAAGQRVRGLVRGMEQAGNYQVMWNGRDDSGSKVAGGVYFYRLMAGEFQSIQKMVLVK